MTQRKYKLIRCVQQILPMVEEIQSKDDSHWLSVHTSIPYSQVQKPFLSSVDMEKYCIPSFSSTDVPPQKTNFALDKITVRFNEAVSVVCRLEAQSIIQAWITDCGMSFNSTETIHDPVNYFENVLTSQCDNIKCQRAQSKETILNLLRVVSSLIKIQSDT